MVTKSILSNGIRVISESIPHAYSVSVGIWVANGSRHESGETSGVAHFIEHLLFKGTKSRSALDIAREIDSIGGILNAFTGREYVCYYAKALSKFLPVTVDILTDIFQNSLFDPEEIEKERKVILQEVSMLEDTPDDYIHDLFIQNIWRDNSLGRPIIGTEESLGSLTRENIMSHLDRAYRSEEIIVTVAGKVNHQELLSLLEGRLSAARPGKSTVTLSMPDFCKGIISTEKDLEQAHLCMGTRAIPYNDRRRYEGFILNTVLGGSMSSRLFQEVREKKGLAYSIYSYISSHSDTGALAVYAGTSTEQVREVVDIVLTEMKKLKNALLSSDELDAAREQIRGNLLLSLESSDNRMSKLAKNEIFFGGYQNLRTIMAGLNRVTPEGVLELAEQIFDEKYFSLSLLGNVPSHLISSESISL